MPAVSRLSNLVGIDDGPFERDHRGDVAAVGTVYAGLRFDGLVVGRWKVELVRQLYARGYTREEIYALFQFLDWLLVLPLEMAEGFWERVHEMDQESKMKYVTSIERLGREKGRDECLRETAVELFEEKFGPLDTSKRNLLDEASQEQVLTWMKRLLTASSLDEILAT